MRCAFDMLIGINQTEEFLCDVCNVSGGNPAIHLKWHMIQTDFNCTDCDFKSGEFTGYDSFVSHVKKARHLNFIYTCMRCSISEFDFPTYMQHLQLHNDDQEKKHLVNLSHNEGLSDIKTESDTKKSSANCDEDQNINDIKTEENDGNREYSGPSNDESVDLEARKVWHVQLEGLYEDVDQSEIMYMLPSTAKNESKQIFQCLVCDIILPKAKEHAHMKKHLHKTTVQREKKSGKIRFICKLCKIKSKREYSEFLRLHVKIHEDAAKEQQLNGFRKKPFQPLYSFDTCRICKEQQDGIVSLFDHVMEHFPNSVFYCRVCFEVYNDYQSCRDHCNNHELELSSKTPFGVYFLCPVCGHLENPNGQRKVIDHLTRVKSGGGVTRLTASCEWKEGNFVCKTITANLMQCNYCCIQFDETIHSCNFRCDDAASLCSHVQQHIISKVVNDVQKGKLEQLPTLKKVGKTKKNQHICSICDEDCLNARDLVNHVLDHYPETSFYCRVCLKTDTRFWSCRNHCFGHRIESGAMPTFHCPLCGKLEIPDTHLEIINHLYEFDAHGCTWTDGALVAPRTNKGAFVCRTLTAFFSDYEHCRVVFDKATSTCDFVCDDAVSLYSHVMLQHVFPVDSNSLPPFNTNSCLTSYLIQRKGTIGFKSGGGVSQSFSQTSDGRKSSVKSQKSVVQNKKTKNPLPHMPYFDEIRKRFCIICSETSSSPSDFFQHVWAHYPDNVYYCRLCFETFTNHTSAISHGKRNCVSTYRDEDRLRDHLGILCSLCDHIGVHNNRTLMIYHLFQHYDQSKDPDFDLAPKIFLCKRMSASLMCYKYFSAEFDRATASCEEKFDNVHSLCDHIKQHIVKSTVTSECEDSESVSSTSSRPFEEIADMNDVGSPQDMPAWGSHAVQLDKASTSVTATSQLNVRQCHGTVMEVTDVSDCPEQNTLIPLNEVKVETTEWVQLNNIESTKSLDLMDLDASTSETSPVSVVHSTTPVSVPHASNLSKTLPMLIIEPDKPKPSANFETKFSANSKRTYESAFTSDSHHTAQNELKQESKQSTKSKIKIFVCKVCGKQFIEEHFLKKHMARH